MANPQPAIRRPQSAMTLVELLVAMSIVAILMLGGVGVYWGMNRGFALQAATSSIESALRAARHSAIYQRSPAVVVAEPQADNPGLVGLVYALGQQTVSNWHFEVEQFAGGKLLGALGQEGVLPVAANSVPGKVGRALLLNGADTCVQVTSPYLDGLREGVFAEAFVWPDAMGLAPGAVLPIACKDARASAVFRLELTYADGEFTPQGAVRLEVGGATQEFSVASTLPIQADQWAHVALAYYRESRDPSGNATGLLVLRVNGEEAARLPVAQGGSTLLLAPSTAPLTIGTDGTSYFKGRIDELKIAGLVAGEVRSLPKNAEVTLDAGGSRDGRVHFDREGRLDPSQHSRPVFFRVVSAEDRLLRTVRVNWLGAVEVFQGDPPPDQ